MQWEQKAQMELSLRAHAVEEFDLEIEFATARSWPPLLARAPSLRLCFFASSPPRPQSLLCRRVHRPASIALLKVEAHSSTCALPRFALLCDSETHQLDHYSILKVAVHV